MIRGQLGSVAAEGWVEMSEAVEFARRAVPDLDLLEYVLVSAPAVDDLAPVGTAVVGLVQSGAIRLVDLVVLVRPDRQVGVSVIEAADHEGMSAVAGVVADEDGGVLLSLHDIELAAATLAPGTAALLLLVEDRWAGVISSAARASGGRISSGERITRDRAEASLAQVGGPSDHRPTRVGRSDLLVRNPLSTLPGAGAVPAVDRAAQVRQLAGLVERGLLSLDQYEVQRRRVLDD